MQEHKPETGKLKEIRIMEPMVLVGFGKHDLVDLWEKKGTDEEYKLFPSVTHWPPRWRRAGICTDEEIKLFEEYTAWVRGLVGL